MKRALLASLDAWQKYWGTDFMSIYCWLHVCISWYSEEKKNDPEFYPAIL